MKRWDRDQGKEIEAPDVDAFLNDLVSVCRKHGMSLGHEDPHGGFLVHRELLPANLGRLSEASIAARGSA